MLFNDCGQYKAGTLTRHCSTSMASVLSMLRLASALLLLASSESSHSRPEAFRTTYIPVQFLYKLLLYALATVYASRRSRFVQSIPAMQLISLIIILQDGSTSFGFATPLALDQQEPELLVYINSSLTDYGFVAFSSGQTSDEEKYVHS